jgi:hypothetical protein
MSKDQSTSRGQDMEKYFHRVSTSNFKKIPSAPIAYWLSESFLHLYESCRLDHEFFVKEGVGTRNDDVFMKMCWEVSRSQIGRSKRWILTDKAGDFRKWYMGPDFLMDWENNGERIKNYRNPDGSLRSRPQNLDFLYKELPRYQDFPSNRMDHFRIVNLTVTACYRTALDCNTSIRELGIQIFIIGIFHP